MPLLFDSERPKSAAGQRLLQKHATLIPRPLDLLVVQSSLCSASDLKISVNGIYIFFNAVLDFMSLFLR